MYMKAKNSPNVKLIIGFQNSGVDKGWQGRKEKHRLAKAADYNNQLQFLKRSVVWVVVFPRMGGG
jgi:hypothetical protein